MATIALLAATAPPAVAATESLATPTGTFHVVYGADAHEPSTRSYYPCIDRTCLGFGVPVPQDLGGVDGRVDVWEETNGCPSLQTQQTICSQTGHWVPADDRHAHIQAQEP